MSRFQTALRLADDNPDLEGVATRLLQAVREAKAEGVNQPEDDPAVMLLGVRVAFMTHADIGTTSMYRQLIDLCDARARANVIGSFGARQ